MAFRAAVGVRRGCRRQATAASRGKDHLDELGTIFDATGKQPPFIYENVKLRRATTSVNQAEFTQTVGLPFDNAFFDVKTLMTGK